MSYYFQNILPPFYFTVAVDHSIITSFFLKDVYEKAVLFEILSFPPFITKAVLFGSAKITNIYLV